MRFALRFCVFVLLNFTVGAFAQSGPPPSVPTVLPAVYQHWLDEDVRWIIGPNEKKTFESLTGNDERDRFITQFWLRRDPTPGTSENELKEEHYRRLAYANQHFAARELGDLTDRGRIYVVYGPPDNVEHRVTNGVSAEVWYYEDFPKPEQPVVVWEGKRPRPSNPVILDFLDHCQCNDYRLMTPLPN